MVLAVLGVAFTPAPAAAAAHTITYDRYSLKIDGKRVYIWSGEFHAYRLPSPKLWRDVLQKMKAGGYNAASIYFDWNYHSQAPHQYDFTGFRDMDRLMRIASQVGIYVIARPGPYINAETDAGGFPGWIITQHGRARTSAPDYLAAALEWTHAIDTILARHQLTNGTGTLILYQVENEYAGKKVDRSYMAALERQVRADGITVPLTHNSCCGDGGRWASGVGAVNINGIDSYPQGFDCTHPGNWGQPDDFTKVIRANANRAPLYMAEFGGGAFDPWGGPGYAKCRELTNANYERVFYENNVAWGATLQNFYMTFGGTSWAWIADPEAVYTSYDYGSPIDEARGLGAKYDQQKLLGYMLAAVAPLRETVAESIAPPSNPVIRVDARVNPITRTQFLIVRHAEVTSLTHDRTLLALHTADGTYPRVPQLGAIAVNGRDSKLLIAHYQFGSADLVYSTSDLLTDLSTPVHDLAILYGRTGEQGETVLRYSARPIVRAPSGVRVTWDAKRRDLRLDYTHAGLMHVRIVPSDQVKPLDLYVGTNETAAKFWRISAGRTDAVVRGPYLVRTARLNGTTLDLTGDTDRPEPLEVYEPETVTRVTWNGRSIATSRTPDGTLTAALAGPVPVALPAPAGWRVQSEAPEIAPAFDDSSWTIADRTSTNATVAAKTLPVLYADDYGFHYGDVWYRGHFTAGGRESGITLDGYTGNAGAYAVWLNGVYLGAQSVGEVDHVRHFFAFPSRALHAGSGNVVSILLENMGHDEDFDYDDTHKFPRGIGEASIAGLAGPISWRVQGGSTIFHGGLYGERNAWYAPAFDDRSWPAATQPLETGTAGVRWYRTNVSLNTPRGQDVSIGIRVDGTDKSRWRALVYVNGFLMGHYVNDLGPQHLFVLPNGVLHEHGQNSIALAVWNLDENSTTFNTSLQVIHNTLSSLRQASL